MPGGQPKRLSDDEIIRALRERREEMGIPRERLATIMGYDHSLLGRWERGDVFPNYIRLKDWCDALGLDLTIKPKNGNE